MTRRVLSEKEWENLVRELFKSFAHSSLPNRGDNVKAAKALKVSLSTIEQMKSYGKGSLKTWIKLASYRANLSPDEVRAFFNNFPGLLKEIKPLSDVDRLFEEIKKQYNSQEIAALLHLLLSKRDVEKFVGINIKVSKRKKQ